MFFYLLLQKNIRIGCRSVRKCLFVKYINDYQYFMVGSLVNEFVPLRIMYCRMSEKK